jgi:hypothetical protein
LSRDRLLDIGRDMDEESMDAKLDAILGDGDGS